MSPFDPADEIDDAATQQRIAAAERSLGGDIRVRVETAVDGGLDARVAQLVAQCPGWDSGEAQLDDDLIVVMFSPTEREAAVYYGADNAELLEDQWESVVDSMTGDLRSGDYDDAVASGMDRLVNVSTLTVVPDEADDSDDGGSDFPIGWILLLIVGAGARWLYSQFFGEAGIDEDLHADGSGWFTGGSSSRRSFSSSSSSSSRRSFGGSSRRSSSGSRRAGGGSKRW